MKKSRNEKKDLRQFGATLAVILLVFGLIHFLKHRLVLSLWFFGIGSTALFAAILIPMILKPVYAVFLKVAHAIGWFNTRALLIIIYFILVTPIAIIMRICGKDLLHRKVDKDAATYWIKKPVTKLIKEHLEKQF